MACPLVLSRASVSPTYRYGRTFYIATGGQCFPSPFRRGIPAELAFITRSPFLRQGPAQRGSEEELHQDLVVFLPVDQDLPSQTPALNEPQVLVEHLRRDVRCANLN